MQSLAEFPRGIPIPVDEIRSALESAAVPGTSGSIQIVIGLKPTVPCKHCGEIVDLSDHVTFAVVRRLRMGTEHPAQTQVLPDVTRKKPVQNVLRAVTGKMQVRMQIQALEFYVEDGILQDKKFLVEE